MKMIYFWLTLLGFDPRKLLFTLRAFPGFIQEYRLLQKQNLKQTMSWKIRPNMPCLSDRFAKSGTVQGHYFIQDLFVAQKIFQAQPLKHVDVASRVDGFVAHLAAFRTVEVFDIRPLAVPLPNIVFHQCDFMYLPENYVNYSASVSCLHALEHFGLGRYGDPIDIMGYQKGFENLARIVQKGGTLYLSVPIGHERIEFNGQRIFAIQTILNLAAHVFDLTSFSYIDDKGAFWPGFDLNQNVASPDLGLNFGCGIFEFVKRMN